MNNTTHKEIIEEFREKFCYEDGTPFSGFVLNHNIQAYQVEDWLLTKLTQVSKEAEEKTIEKITDIIKNISYEHVNCNITDGVCRDHQILFNREGLNKIFVLNGFSKAILEEFASLYSSPEPKDRCHCHHDKIPCKCNKNPERARFICKHCHKEPKKEQK